MIIGSKEERHEKNDRISKPCVSKAIEDYQVNGKRYRICEGEKFGFEHRERDPSNTQVNKSHVTRVMWKEVIHGGQVSFCVPWAKRIAGHTINTVLNV